MYTTAMRLPTLSRVKSSMREAPTPSSVTDTMRRTALLIETAGSADQLVTGYDQALLQQNRVALVGVEARIGRNAAGLCGA